MFRDTDIAMFEAFFIAALERGIVEAFFYDLGNFHKSADIYTVITQ